MKPRYRVGRTTIFQPPKVPLVLDPDDPLGLLPLRALGRDLGVTFEGLDFTTIPNRTDLVELGLMARGAAPFLSGVSTRPNSCATAAALTIPKEPFNPGRLRCFDPLFSQHGQPYGVLEKRITIDTTKPNFGLQPDAVIFPDELNGVITESYLTQHGQVIVEVPHYTDVAAGDRAVYFWTDQLDPSDREKLRSASMNSASRKSSTSVCWSVQADESAPGGTVIAICISKQGLTRVTPGQMQGGRGSLSISRRFQAR